LIASPLLTLALASPAYAQPAPPPKAAAPAPPAAASPGAAAKPAAPVKEEDVAKIIAAAQKAAKASKWDEARALYDSAIKSKPSVKLYVEAAKVDIAAGAPRDAAERMIVALAYAPADLSGADRKAAEDVLSQAKSKIGELRFNVNPKGAEILVDGVSLGQAPIDSPVFVDPGPVEVSAKKDGYTGVKTSRNVAAGSVETFQLDLHRAPGSFDTTPAPSQANTIFRGVKMPIFISGAAATGVFLIMGAAFAIVSDGKASSSHALEQPGATCGMMCKPEFDSLQAAKVNYAGASMWMFILSGTAALGTGAYWATMAIMNKPQPVKAGLLLAPGVAGASLSGQW